MVRAKLTPTHAIDVGCQPYRAFQGGRFRVLLSCWDELGGSAVRREVEDQVCEPTGRSTSFRLYAQNRPGSSGGLRNPAIRVRSLTGQEELEFSKRVGTNLRLGDISA